MSVPCSRCGGRGSYSDPAAPRHYAPGTFVLPDLLTCEACKGRGRTRRHPWWWQDLITLAVQALIVVAAVAAAALWLLVLLDGGSS